MMEKRQVSLQDKYILEEGRAFMTGIQALVRLPMVQRRLDQSRGWDTGGFISGYRGSPLGALDQQLVLNRKLLEEHHVRFNPGVNEDLAATSIWGTSKLSSMGRDVTMEFSASGMVKGRASIGRETQCVMPTWQELRQGAECWP